jgi:hypothetical protein
MFAVVIAKDWVFWIFTLEGEAERHLMYHPQDFRNVEWRCGSTAWCEISSLLLGVRIIIGHYAALVPMVS